MQRFALLMCNICKIIKGGKYMKRTVRQLILFLLAAFAALALYSCKSGGVTSAAKSTENTHEHTPFDGNNVIEHVQEGYCGNTYTTVEYNPDGKTLWKRSFMSTNSIEVTDMLRYLNYKDEICECEPEYRVYTEGGCIYGVSLKHGFVRSDTAQVNLTEEQLAKLSKIMDAIGNMTDDTVFDVN